LPWHKRLFKPENILGYSFLLPALFVLFIVLLIPLVDALWISLHFKPIGAPAEWVGLQNYIDNINDPDFIQATQNTIVYTVSAVVLKGCLGLLVALILNQDFMFRSIARALILMPWALPQVSSILAWQWMLDGNLGAMNYMLRSAGFIERNIYWISDPEIAMPIIIGVNIWRGFPFFAITLLAGLQGIDKTLYEAADVDGATLIQKFRHITIPGIMPVLLVSSLLSTIWTANNFTGIFVLTGGGPGNATTNLPIYAFRTAFGGSFDRGGAISVSVMMMPFIIILIVLLTRAISNREASS